MIFSIPLCASPLQFTTTDISLWMTTYTCHSHDHSSSLLLLQDASKYSPLSRESFELLPCSSFRIKTLRLFPHIYRGSVHPNCSCVSQKFFGILFDLSKILC